MSFPTYADLVGHDFDDVDGNGLTHRHWMGNVGDLLDAFITDDGSSIAQLHATAYAGQTDALLVLTTDGDPLDPGKIALSVTKYDGTPDVHHFDDDGGLVCGQMSLSESGAFSVDSIDAAFGGGTKIFNFSHEGNSLFWVLSPEAGYNAIIQPHDAGDVALIVYGWLSQTADILQVRDADTDGVLFAVGPGGEVGFFDKADTPASQATHPTTLGDVITILTNLGLCAA